MTQQEKNRDIIKRSESVESYSEALEVVNACEQLGDAEINDFLFEYVRIGTKNEHLEAAIEDRIYFDEEWLFKVVQYRNIFKVVHEFGLEAVANVESRELVEEAATHKKKGNIEEAIKCLNEALELGPGDNEIERSLERLISESITISINDEPLEGSWANTQIETFFKPSGRLLVEFGKKVKKVLLDRLVGEETDVVTEHQFSFSSLDLGGEPIIKEESGIFVIEVYEEPEYHKVIIKLQI